MIRFVLIVPRLILTVVLAFLLACSAWSQVPRNGSQQDYPTQTEQHNAKPIQQPATTIQIELCAPKQEQDTNYQAPSYQWHELLTPANIPNWSLALVGIWAALLALRSLKAIEQQTNTMDRQLNEMQRQTNWLIEKERPRLSIELDRFDPQTDEFTGEYCVTGAVSIYGHTIARIKKAEICVSTEPHVLEIAFETPIHAFRSWSPDEIELPRVIHPNSHDTRFIAAVYREPSIAASPADIRAVLERCKSKSVLCGEFFDTEGLRVSPVPKVLNSSALYCRARIEYFFGNNSWTENVEMKFLVFDDPKITPYYGCWEYHYIEEQDDANNPS